MEVPPVNKGKLVSHHGNNFVTPTQNPRDIALGCRTPSKRLRTSEPPTPSSSGKSSLLAFTGKRGRGLGQGGHTSRGANVLHLGPAQCQAKCPAWLGHEHKATGRGGETRCSQDHAHFSQRTRGGSGRLQAGQHDRMLNYITLFSH